MGFNLHVPFLMFEDLKMVIIETVKKNNFDNIYEILYIKDDDDFENFLSDSYQRLDLG